MFDCIPVFAALKPPVRLFTQYTPPFPKILSSDSRPSRLMDQDSLNFDPMLPIRDGKKHKKMESNKQRESLNSNFIQWQP